MPSIPSAIIFMNNEINPPLQQKLVEQLEITDVMTGTEFDDRVTEDPNYPLNIELNQLRILVLRDSLQDTTNREYADVVMFVKGGLASILYNKYGPPAATLDINRITMYSLLVNKDLQSGVTNAFPRPIQDLLINPYDPSGIHDANSDNIFNNNDFLNRK